MTRFRIVTSAGILVIYDSAIPPGGDSDNPGFVGYWNDFETESLYVFDRLLFTPDDVAVAIGSLERYFVFDPGLFASDDPGVSRISSDDPPESPLGKGGGEGTILVLERSEGDDGSWQPASRESILAIMGFGAEEDGSGGVAAPPWPCWIIWMGAIERLPRPPPGASPDDVLQLAAASAWCPPHGCTGPCCVDPCCGDPCCGDPCCGDPCCINPCSCDPCCVDPCSCDPCCVDPCSCDPCCVDPCSCDPCCVDPCSCDPCCVDPCSCDPCCVDPCSCDPCCVDPCSCKNCDDGDACNGTETCSGGACVAGTPMNCDDGIPCTTDGCSAGTCTTESKCPLGVLCCKGACCLNTPQNSCCGGDPAPICCPDDACCEGVCINNNTECCPGKPCPAGAGEVCCGACDSCVATGCCSGAVCPDGSCCSDGTPCTQDVCVCADPPFCTGYTCEFPPVCFDGNPCTDNVCNVSECNHTTCSFPDADDCTACPDGSCINGTCVLVVNLHFEGVREDDEEYPGAFVSTWEEQDQTLPGLTLKGGPGLTGSVKFEVTGGTGGFQLYSDPQGMNVLPLLNQTILVSQLPKTFYVKGYVVSPTPRDIEFHVTSNDPAMPCEDKVKLTVVELKLKSLTFTTDHDLLRNNLSDFEPTGDVFPEPKWEAGRTPYEDFPISHTMGQNVGVDAKFELLPPGSNPPQFALSTQSPQGFHFSKEISLPGGESVLSLTSDDQLEDKIQKLEGPVEWTITHSGRVLLRKTAGPYRTFVTMGTPRYTSDPRYVVTWNRMARAVYLAGETGSLNPYAIVQELVWAVGPFDLNRAQDNAWLVPDRGGDCQSIVRLGIKVANMIDLPGEYEHTNIYAIEDDPGTPIFEPAVAIVGSPYDGLGYPERWHPTKPWTLRLIDYNGGCNAFEATIKYSCGIEPLYFPGGVRDWVFDNKDGVLSVFDSLSWKTGSCSVQEIVYQYSEPVYNPMPPPCP